MLDIFVLNEKGQPERPWLTVILDDYSRTVAGYFLTFQAPSTIQTALTLHPSVSPNSKKISVPYDTHDKWPAIRCFFRIAGLFSTRSLNRF